MSAELATVVTAVGGAVLSKFVGPIAEHYGKAALERLQHLGTKAEQLLASVGREPQPVEPRQLVPLVQAASLETDASLADKWAALLANTADPAQKVQVRPSFTDVLRQLTVDEVRIIDWLYRNRVPITVYDDGAPAAIFTKELDVQLGILPTGIAIAVDNLIRLRICELPIGMLAGGESITTNSPHFKVIPTIFGQAFYESCTPPTA